MSAGPPARPCRWCGRTPNISSCGAPCATAACSIFHRRPYSATWLKKSSRPGGCGGSITESAPCLPARCCASRHWRPRAFTGVRMTGTASRTYRVTIPDSECTAPICRPRRSLRERGSDSRSTGSRPIAGKERTSWSSSNRDAQNRLASRLHADAQSSARQSEPIPTAKETAMTKAATTGDSNKPFLTDVQTLRDRARRHLETGNVTQSYQGDVKHAIAVLQSVLATEIVCVLRYTMHAVAATGISSEGVKAEFAQHAKEEQMHMMAVAERINQLGGTPNFNPEGLLTRSASQYAEGGNLIGMIRENYIAERIAIDHYRELIRYF